MGKSSGGGGDPVAAARIQGELSRETARDLTYADRADQYNPFGALEWSTQIDIDPATGQEVTRWIQNQTYDPAVMNILDQNMGVVGSRATLANMLQDRVAAEMGAEPDWGQFGDVIGLQYDPTQMRQRAEDAYYQRETSRLDPRFQGQEESLDIKLRNQGLRPGDQAYDAQMNNLAFERNDAYEQARRNAIMGGQSEAGQLFQQQVQSANMANALRNQQIQEYLGQRSFSLDESNRLMEGQTVADISNLMGA